jgi:hypothetical protein
MRSRVSWLRVVMSINGVCGFLVISEMQWVAFRTGIGSVIIVESRLSDHLCHNLSILPCITNPMMVPRTKSQRLH